MASTTVLGDSLSESNRIVDLLFNMLIEYGQGDYIGERVSQIEHSLQAADRARNAGASDATVLAALLHDCGHILPQSVLNAQIRSDEEFGKSMILPSGQSVGKHGHDLIGGAYLSSLGFPPSVCELVRDHVVAKRYLTAVEEGYYDSLSEASKHSLGFQGGPFTPSEVEQFKKDSLFKEKVQMRRFDDAAKVVGARVPSLNSYKELALKFLQEE